MILRRTLLLSAVLHALALAAMLGGTLTSRAATAHYAEPIVPGAALSGDTFEVDAVRDEPPAKRAESEPRKTSEAEPVARPAAPPKPEPATEPKPKPKPKPAPAKATEQEPASASADSTESSETKSEDEPATTGARYGAAGLPPGVRHLATAFTKAISAATNRDPIWDQLPIGPIGKARVVIDVDDDGRISHQPFDAEDPIAPALKRLVERTLLLLRAGRFALRPDRAGAGREILELDVTLSMVTPPEGEWDDPTHTAKIGFDPPAPGVPGRAYFVHASGRRFDARVTIRTPAN